jgi:FkbM family methyltransferase
MTTIDLHAPVNSSTPAKAGSSRVKRLSPSHIRSALLARLFPIVFRRVRGSDLVHLGSEFGGWWVQSAALDRGSLCYCVGVGEDASFDFGLVTHFACRVVSLDPTPRAVAYVKTLDLPQTLMFLPVGVAGTNREARFYAPRDPANVSYSMANLQHTEASVIAPVRTLSSIMKDLGHSAIDLLKLDIEGAEYEVLDSLHRDGIYPRTLCVEFDQPHPVLDTWRTVKRLRRVGYEPVMVDGLNCTFVRTSPAEPIDTSSSIPRPGFSDPGPDDSRGRLVRRRPRSDSCSALDG